VILTLLVSATIYVLVAFVESRLGAGVAAGGSPLVPIGEQEAGVGLATALRVGALSAMVGVLLNLILGLSRVALAMGRRRDLPAVIARVDRDGRTPVPAVLLVTGIVTAFVLVGDIRTTWSFSALTVLVYYALTNLSALRQPVEERRFPRIVQILGLVGCLGLAVFIDPAMWLWGGGLVAAGLSWHLLRRRAGSTG
jgi:APA family basic amino acid/polyamine antiporter